MKLDLAAVAQTPGARWKEPFTLSLPADEELQPAGPVTGTLTVTNTGSLLLVQGELTATIRLECARCAEPFELPISAPIQEEFSLRTPEGKPLEPVQTVDLEEPAAAAFADNVLDLSELVRQQLLVSVPITPLCNPECRGLCRHCGKNLNSGPCGCPAAPEDSPFAALKSLLDKPRRRRSPG